MTITELEGSNTGSGDVTWPSDSNTDSCDSYTGSFDSYTGSFTLGHVTVALGKMTVTESGGAKMETKLQDSTKR